MQGHREYTMEIESELYFYPPHFEIPIKNSPISKQFNEYIETYIKKVMVCLQAPCPWLSVKTQSDFILLYSAEKAYKLLFAELSSWIRRRTPSAECTGKTGPEGRRRICGGMFN